MDKQDMDTLKKLINDYGPRETLEAFHLALKECADEMADLGLRERAYKVANLADALDYIHDAMDPTEP